MNRIIAIPAIKCDGCGDDVMFREVCMHCRRRLARAKRHRAIRERDAIVKARIERLQLAVPVAPLAKP